jgi:hypothetical protein
MVDRNFLKIKVMPHSAELGQKCPKSSSMMMQPHGRELRDVSGYGVVVTSVQDRLNFM